MPPLMTPGYLKLGQTGWETGWEDLASPGAPMRQDYPT
ncbi:hypothetical protein MMSP_3018 [Mycobacterium sp. 012931]|nr:hypothetical protein MMSP_3018 [Mycobacterium sp. 012931]